MPSLLEPTEEEWQAVPEQAIAIYKAAYDAEKPPYSPTMRHIGEALQMMPSSTGIPNLPNPLSSMLAGGMLGAGAGYGMGWLGEHILPEHWQRGRLRRTAAILGGLGGAIPGALWMYANHATGKSPLAGPIYNGPPMKNAHFKEALLAGAGEIGDLPLIDAREFNENIWRNPNVAPYIPVATRAAASGLLAGAAHLAEDSRPSNMVSPFDVARLAAGMGSGYMSGLAVGKTLGLLTGMPQETQDFLKNTGMYAGIVKTIVPKAFGA